MSKSSKTVLTGSSIPTNEMMLLHKSEGKNDFGELSTTFLNAAHPKPSQIDNEIKMSAASLTSYWGQQIAFKDIVKSGALVKKSDGNYGAANGFTMG